MPALRPSPARPAAPRNPRRQGPAARPVAPARRPALARHAARPAALLGSADARMLRARLGAQLLLPGDDAYETGRFGHNTSYDKRPAAIVRPRDARGIAAAPSGLECRSTMASSADSDSSSENADRTTAGAGVAASLVIPYIAS